MCVLNRRRFFFLLFFESDAPGDKTCDETESDDSISIKTDLHNEKQNEDISYQTIRNVFNTGESTRARYNENKRLIDEFRTKPFEELKSLINKKQKQIEQLLTVHYLPNDQLSITISDTNSTSNEKSVLYMNNFNYPELFTY